MNLPGEIKVSIRVEIADKLDEHTAFERSLTASGGNPLFNATNAEAVALEALGDITRCIVDLYGMSSTVLPVGTRGTAHSDIEFRRTRRNN